MIGSCNCPITGVRLRPKITTLQINESKLQQPMHQSHLIGA